MSTKSSAGMRKRAHFVAETVIVASGVAACLEPASPFYVPGAS